MIVLTIIILHLYSWMCLTQAGQMKPEAAVLSHEAKDVLVDNLFYIDPSTNWETKF